MISVVMSYKDRLELLLPTLKTIGQSKTPDIEVVIVDDASDTPLHSDHIKNTPFPVRLISISKTEKTWINPCVPYNRGIAAASGDVIILQNPECMHVGDIVSYANEHVDNDTYISFGCYAVGPNECNEITQSADPVKHFRDTVKMGVKEFDCDNLGHGWYNHSIYRPTALHFTSAIKKHRLCEIGCFDERYAHGCGYDDDDLLLRIRRAMKVTIVDDPFSVHLYHRKMNQPRDWEIKYARNGDLYRRRLHGK